MHITRVYNTHNKRRLDLKQSITTTRALNKKRTTRTVRGMLRARTRARILQATAGIATMLLLGVVMYAYLIIL